MKRFEPGVRHYVRFLYRDHEAYGLVQADLIHELKGNLFCRAV